MTVRATVADQAEPSEAARNRNRNRIPAAAAEIAAGAGYEGTTISKITKRSGLPVSSAYWFFADAEELLAEVVQLSYDRWVDAQPSWAPVPTGVRVVRAWRSTCARPRTTESLARNLFLSIRANVEQAITDWYSDNLPLRAVERRPDLGRHLAQITMAAVDGLFLARQVGGAIATAAVDATVARQERPEGVHEPGSPAIPEQLPVGQWRSRVPQ